VSYLVLLRQRKRRPRGASQPLRDSETLNGSSVANTPEPAAVTVRPHGPNLQGMDTAGTKNGPRSDHQVAFRAPDRPTVPCISGLRYSFNSSCGVLNGTNGSIAVRYYIASLVLMAKRLENCRRCQMGGYDGKQQLS
jgi:hypothetical protein